MLSRSQREKGGTEHVEIVSSVSPSTVVLLKAPLHLSTCWWLQQHCYFVAKSCLALLRTAGRQSLCPWDFPGENTGVGCHFLLQGIFLTQGLTLLVLCLLHWTGGRINQGVESAVSLGLHITPRHLLQC